MLQIIAILFQECKFRNLSIKYLRGIQNCLIYTKLVVDLSHCIFINNEYIFLLLVSLLISLISLSHNLMSFCLESQLIYLLIVNNTNIFCLLLLICFVKIKRIAALHLWQKFNLILKRIIFSFSHLIHWEHLGCFQRF